MKNAKIVWSMFLMVLVSMFLSSVSAADSDKHIWICQDDTLPSSMSEVEGIAQTVYDAVTDPDLRYSFLNSYCTKLPKGYHRKAEHYTHPVVAVQFNGVCSDIEYRFDSNFGENVHVVWKNGRSSEFSSRSRDHHAFTFMDNARPICLVAAASSLSMDFRIQYN